MWTQERVLELQSYQKQGMIAAHIAQKMGTTKGEIYNVTHRLKNRRPPKILFKCGDKVKVNIARGMVTYGIVLLYDGRPILAYRDYSKFQLWQFNKVVEASGLDWIGEPIIHYV